jgi:molybdopterin biosynthesis enzyme
MLNKINNMPDIVVSTLHNNTPVEKREKVAGAKVIPLVVKEDIVRQVEQICANGSLLTVLPYLRFKMGGVVTGREVVEGRIKDGFAPVLKEKASFFGMDEPEILYAPDQAEIISQRIQDLLDQDCDLIMVTGGMSVDPDDVTPAGIKKIGARIVKYGAPALPGAMFLLAYKGNIPIIGLPACAMYYRTTVLDIILPRIMAGEFVEAQDISSLGHGGLCRTCDHCIYPDCSFGKGAV